MGTAGFLLLCCLNLAQATLTLGVTLHDSSGADAEDLAAARSQVSAIFREAGIAVSWGSASRPREESDPFQITVLLRKRDPNWTPKRRPIMGVALAPDARRGVTTIYYSAIADVARQYSQPVPALLAIAIAHEIGHLLLPHPAHSSDGIMRADWEGDDLRRAALQPLHFTSAEAARMRQRVSVAR